MDEEKKLYPFRLCTVEDGHSWGNETWQLADLGWRDTPVRDGWLCGNSMGEMMETYLDRLVGDEVFDWYGQQFPFAVKSISVEGKMPLSVCPSDETARIRFDSLGKEKLWYIKSASNSAKLLLGLSKDTPLADFMSACEDGSVDNMLNSVSIKAGEAYYIPSGVPHCIIGSATVLEISECSALDFCLCSWGQALEDKGTGLSLGLIEALDFINLSRFSVSEALGFNLLSIPQFSCNRLSLSDALRISNGQNSEGNSSCVAYSCVGGELSVQLPMDGDQKIDYLVVKDGETVLIPAEVEEFFLVPREKETVLLETLIEHRSELDSYVPEGSEE